MRIHLLLQKKYAAENHHINYVNSSIGIFMTIPLLYSSSRDIREALRIVIYLPMRPNSISLYLSSN